MSSRDLLEPRLEAGAEQRPHIALVQHGIFVGGYGPDEAEAADRAAYRLALAGGYHVDVYHVDTRTSAFPRLGEPVDPQTCGWTRVD